MLNVFGKLQNLYLKQITKQLSFTKKHVSIHSSTIARQKEKRRDYMEMWHLAIHRFT